MIYRMFIHVFVCRCSHLLYSFLIHDTVINTSNIYNQSFYMSWVCCKGGRERYDRIYIINTISRPTIGESNQGMIPLWNISHTQALPRCDEIWLIECHGVCRRKHTSAIIYRFGGYGGDWATLDKVWNNHP